VLAVIPESIDARRNMAKVYLEQNKLEQAKQLLHECVQINPKDDWACIMLGNIYARDENKLDLGAFYYELCLEHHPDDAMAMSNYAALMMETRQFQKAEVLFKKALKIQDIPNAYYGLAFLYRMANELEAARQVLERFFERVDGVKEVEGLPVYKAAQGLYRELSKALGAAGKGN
jgi:tetratricopeptide (TPR) repeat protein